MKKLFALVLVAFVSLYTSRAQVVQLWGMTSEGGESDSGTVFEINADGSGFNVVHSCDTSGYFPYGNLVQASNGYLYGMTYQGGEYGDGVIFEINPNSYTFHKVFDFEYSGVGGYSSGSLNVVGDMLYGMTTGGGMNGNGTLFSFDPTTKNFNHLFDFSDIGATYPFGSLLLASDGDLYGLTTDILFDTTGTLFKYNIAADTVIVLHKFSSATGIGPMGSLIQAKDSNLYGMTYSGGLYYKGVIFKYSLSGNQYTDVFDFNDTVGANPMGSLVEFADGLLYGMTSYGGITLVRGTIFSFDPVNNVAFNLLDFDGMNGSSPTGDLIDGGDGLLYGMAPFGGINDGLLFSFDPAGSTLTDLFDFSGTNGRIPLGSLIHINSTGLAKHKALTGVQLYPNPVTNELRIQYAGVAVDNIEIYNLFGEKIYSPNEAAQKGSELRIEVSSLSPGLYFIHLISNQSKWVGKFIKE